MKKFYLITTILLVSIATMAQSKDVSLSNTDIIITANSEKIEAHITEVSSKEIKYKKVSNPNGPTFIIGTEELSSILYSNGDVQVFNGKKGNKPTANTANQQAPKQTTNSSQYLVTASKLNVRDYPSGDSRIIGKVTIGQVVEVLELLDNWALISYGSQDGYVYKSYIQKLHKEETATIAPSSPPPTQTPNEATASSNITNREFAYNYRQAERNNQQQENSNSGDLSVHADFWGAVSGFGGKIGGATGIAMEAGYLSGSNINFIGGGIGWLMAIPGETHILPIYACDRVYFSHRETAPYLNVALGGYPVLKGGKGGGLYFRTGLGIACEAKSGFFVHLNFGYMLTYAEQAGIKAAGHAICFSIGIGGR